MIDLTRWYNADTAIDIGYTEISYQVYLQKENGEESEGYPVRIQCPLDIFPNRNGKFIFSNSWKEWEHCLQGDFGIDTNFKIWFELETDKTLYTLRWL